MDFLAACIERADTNSAWGDGTTLLNLTNIALGLAVFIVLLVMVCAVMCDVVPRAKRRLSSR